MPRVEFEPKTLHALDSAANTLVKWLTIKLLQVAIKNWIRFPYISEKSSFGNVRLRTWYSTHNFPVALNKLRKLRSMGRKYSNWGGGGGVRIKR
jgi:hypothetical protein